MGHLDHPSLNGAHVPPLADHLGAGAACCFLGWAQPGTSPYGILERQAGGQVGAWVVGSLESGPGEAACSWVLGQPLMRQVALGLSPHICRMG